jgi:16S rRNA pseudouridine516 synthase
MRLDKLVSSVTDLSRSQARALIREGSVSVAGAVVTDPALAVAEDAEVTLDGAPLRGVGYRYFMLNKPEGYVCANRDRRHSTVFELLAEDNLDALGVAGRLDIDTTGLVLITDDGQWAHRVTSPRAGCDKCYRVRTAEPIAPETARLFERGLFLKAEKTRLKPAQLELLDSHEALLTIAEGRYHQVKRMFGAIGNAVVALHRERVGAIALDADLAPGEYRRLTEAEIASVK